MNRLVASFIAVALTALVAEVSAGTKDNASYVDAMIGTGGNGNCCPGPVWPLGMVQPGPDTMLITKPHDHHPEEFSDELDYRSMPNGYDPNAPILFGFTQTHLSGTGCTDLMDFLLLPFQGEYIESTKGRIFGRMDKASEVAQAGYYKVYLPEQEILCEVTASKRVAYYRFTFKRGGTGRIFFDTQAGSFPWFRMHDPNQSKYRVTYSESRVDRKTGMIEAMNRVSCWNIDREVYGRFEFSKNPVKVAEVGRRGRPGRRYVLDFDVAKGEAIEAKAAISSVDDQGARDNLASDGAAFGFDARVKACKQAWNDLFARAAVMGDDRQKKLFFTALYHAYVQPNLFSDVDGRARFQLLGRYRKVKEVIRPAGSGEIYTTLSTWDTYRAAHPLYTLLTPHYAGEFANSMVAWYDAMGRMPKWQMFGGENFCMIGPHSITIVADALTKGLVKEDPKRLLKAMVETCVCYNGDMADFDKYGYIPADRSGGTVSTALEWCMVAHAIAVTAKAAGDAEAEKLWSRRAQYYRNLYDKPTGMMRARFKDGTWRTPFDPYKQKPTAEDEKNRIPNDYTEGGAMQYSWHVLNDPAGLTALHGGAKGLAAHLESLFTDHTEVSADGATGECSGTIGQFALGNEHDQHVPYLWQYAGRPDRCAEVIRELCDRYYGDGPDGICGNDDCGQMSAWYVFACLGFYPVNPVGGEYVIGAPQVPGATFDLENGKRFTMTAKNWSKANKYVKSVTLNGRKLEGFILRHADLMNGGELIFEMGTK